MRSLKDQESQHDIAGEEQSWKTDETQLSHRNRGSVKKQTDQRDRMQSPETDPRKHSQLIFDRGAKAIRWSRDHLLNKWHWNSGRPHAKEIHPEADFTPFTKINSKGIISLNVKCRTIKPLEDNTGET